MLITRDVLKAIAVATTSDETKYQLSSLLIEPDGRVVATDGHILLVASQSTPLPDADFPSAGVPVFAGNPKTAVLLPTDTAARLIGATSRGKPTIPALTHIQVGCTDDGKAYATATDLAVPVSVPLVANGGDATFPAYARALPPADRPHHTVMLAGKVLAQLAKVAAILGNTKDTTKGTVRFEIPSDPKAYAAVAGTEARGCLELAIRIVIHGQDGVEIVGAVMPCR